MLETAVFSFRILSDGNEIDVVIFRLEARNTESRPDVGVQSKRLFSLYLFITRSMQREDGKQGTCLSEGKVERWVAFSNGSSQRAF